MDYKKNLVYLWEKILGINKDVMERNVKKNKLEKMGYILKLFYSNYL